MYPSPVRLPFYTCRTGAGETSFFFFCEERRNEMSLLALMPVQVALFTWGGRGTARRSAAAESARLRPLRPFSPIKQLPFLIAPPRHACVLDSRSYLYAWPIEVISFSKTCRPTDVNAVGFLRRRCQFLQLRTAGAITSPLFMPIAPESPSWRQ